MGPYGLKGDLKIKSHSGETSHFRKLNGKTLELRSKDGKTKVLTVLQGGEHGRYALLRFGGIETPEQLHQYSGWEVWTERNNGAQLASGEYYVADLVGCTLRFEGQDLARVRNVWDSGAGDMFEVEKSDGSLVNVPFRDPFIGAVHIKERWIELLLEWILE
jgi:16S rRNA processing protein RimM